MSGMIRRGPGASALVILSGLWLGSCAPPQEDTDAPGSGNVETAQETVAPDYLDTGLAAETRATDLVAHMTLAEKAEQLGHTAPAIERLGVPEYNWWNEGLHGVARAGEATVFPQAIGMAASWDTGLMQEVAGVIGTEFRAKFAETVGPDGGSDWYRGLTVWSPNINIFRDPRWGRGQETYGEDPFLTSQIGTAFIRGLQGEDPDRPLTIATAKHYAVHSGPESNRHREDVHPSPHDLHDTYLPAFRAAVVDGGVQSVMCAYNAVDGIPACASAELMQHYLRESWGFEGYVVSDCGAAANIFREDSLAYADGPEEGVALAFEAGMDLICGDYRNDMSTEAEHIVAAVQSGLLDEAVIDRALVRLFSARYRLGLMDPLTTSLFAGIGPADYDTEDHRDLARRMARASMVLLRNENGLLPLEQAPDRIAVIGPNADSYDALVGNYNGLPSEYSTVLDGLRQRFPESEIVYAMGTGLVGEAEPDLPPDILCTDADCTASGLRAERFEGPEIAGDAAETAIIAEPRALWSGELRDRAVRWSGFVTAPETGEYGLRMVSGRGYRILVGDALVTDAWDAEHPPSVPAGMIELEAGETYPIVVEMIQRGPRGDMRLVWTPPGDRTEEAVEAAASADLAVFVGGLSWRVEGEEMRVDAPGFDGGDRTAIGLPAPQQDLLERVNATGTPVVLVLMSGSALAVNWADENIPAIIQAWYPGGEGGGAIAGLLAGDYSPSGRLPVTFYRSADDLPPFSDYAMDGRTYRYFGGEALYPFGHGLSFTQFAYSDPSLSTAIVPAESRVTVSVDVTNAGDIAGGEVVQLYLSRPDVEGAPERSLAGFQRIRLRPGETRRVAFTLSDRMLSTVDEAGVRRVEPGPAEIWIGGGQPVARDGLDRPAGAAASFQITGTAVLPD